MAAASIRRPMFSTIERKLTEALRPTKLVVTDESHLHAGHTGNPSGSVDAETHFRVEVVSQEFTGKPLVARHRLVYNLLDHELKNGIHALTLKLKTPVEQP
eukprot:jgi/Mesen1/6426/ME000329S05582